MTGIAFPFGYRAHSPEYLDFDLHMELEPENEDRPEIGIPVWIDVQEKRLGFGDVLRAESKQGDFHDHAISDEEVLAMRHFIESDDGYVKMQTVMREELQKNAPHYLHLVPSAQEIKDAFYEQFKVASERARPGV